MYIHWCLYHQACVDRQQPLECAVLDHGSWDGRWPLPSRSEWQLHQRLGGVYPGLKVKMS